MQIGKVSSIRYNIYTLNMTICSGNFVILLFGVTDCLSTYGVCQDTFTRKPICCSDFEMVNFTCLPCKTGYTSDGGNPCKICPDNSYGKNCINQCNCSKYERCDNVMGCVNKIITTILRTILSTGTVTQISPTTDEGTMTTRTKESSSGAMIPLYSLSVGGLIILILLCHVVIEYRHTRANAVQLRTEAHAETNQPAINGCIEV